VAQLPRSEGTFHPKFLTKTAFGDYLEELKDQEYSNSHLERVKTVVNGFANWLIAEGEIRTNPTRGIIIAPQALLAPRELSKDQRLVLRNLVERSRDLRGKAMFALGYWAGYRVSDVSYLLMKHTQVGGVSTSKPENCMLRFGCADPFLWSLKSQYVLSSLCQEDILERADVLMEESAELVRRSRRTIQQPTSHGRN